MRILQLISSGGYYGAENMLLNLVTALDQLGCKCTVGVFNNLHKPNTEIAEHARRRGLPVEIIACEGRVDLSAVRSIRNCIRAHSIDVVHTHGYKADFYGCVATRLLPVSLVSTCHLWTRQTYAIRLYELLDAIFLRRFDKVVAVSDVIAEDLRRSGVKDRKITTLSNGIDLSCFDGAPATLLEEIGRGNRTVIGTVGRLVGQKGHEYFLRAAREIVAGFPSTLFVIVGEGPDRPKLEDMARKFGIDGHVIFTGQRTDMPGVYASLDIFVLASLDEGMPISVLEALAARKPVVATRVGAVPKLISTEQTGLLVEPGDVAGLRTAIVSLLERPELRQLLGQRGHERVRQQHSSQVMARNYLNLYRSLVGA